MQMRGGQKSDIFVDIINGSPLRAPAAAAAAMC